MNTFCVPGLGWAPLLLSLCLPGSLPCTAPPPHHSTLSLQTLPSVKPCADPSPLSFPLSPGWPVPSQTPGPYSSLLPLYPFCRLCGDVSSASLLCRVTPSLCWTEAGLGAEWGLFPTPGQPVWGQPWLPKGQVCTIDPQHAPGTFRCSIRMNR